MHHRISLWVLAAVALVGGPRPAAASELHRIRNARARAGSALEVAEAVLLDRAGQLRLHDVELEHRVTLAFGDYRTVRFVQTLDGLPVIGHAAAVRVAPDGRVTVVALHVARELMVATTPRIGPSEVRIVLASLVGPQAAAGRLVTRLAVLPERDGPGLLVWQVDVPDRRGGVRYLVDAHRGVVVGSRPLAIHVQGRVYEISRVNTPLPVDVELTDLDDASPQLLTGWSGRLIVGNYAGGGTYTELYAEQTLQPNSGEDFLYDPPVSSTDASDGFAQVNLYHHLTRMRDFYAGTLGLDMSGPAWSLFAMANMKDEGAAYDNAFYSEMGMGPPWNTQNLIAIGQGQSFDFADDSDVMLHEFTHFVSNRAVGFNTGFFGTNEWGRTGFSGSVDEGLSDYFASTVNGNAVLGETSLQPFGMERDLSDTSKTCPADMIGESHADGEIIGSLSWSLRVALGTAVADQLVWGAMTLLVPSCSFADYGAALIQSANDLVTAGQLTAGDVQTVQDELDARGITGCGYEILVTEEQPVSTYLPGYDYIAAQFGRTCQEIRDMGRTRQSMFHFYAVPNPTDVGIRFNVQFLQAGGNDFQFEIYGRQGEHVTFVSTGGYGMEIDQYDYLSSQYTTDQGSLRIDVDSDPPFDPSQSYHIIVMHANCPDAVMQVAVESIVDPALADAGVDGAVSDGGVTADASGDGEPDNPDEGCGCRSAGDAGAALPPLLLLLALLWLRRRRSR